MGLDMYLNRMPRYRGATAQDVSAVENYLDWLRAKENDSEYANCTFEDWCGHKKIPSKSYIDFYSQFYTEGKYGFYHIAEQVGYWRKANQIHNWFVENVQDGIDDCNYHREVTEEDLRELLDICERVIASCVMVDGQIQNGTKYENGKMIPIMQNGSYVKDPSVARDLLPSTSGFFFGSTEYDEWYVDDIRITIDIIKQVLKSTNFNTQMIYYVSSW